MRKIVLKQKETKKEKNQRERERERENLKKWKLFILVFKKQ